MIEGIKIPQLKSKSHATGLYETGATMSGMPYTYYVKLKDSLPLKNGPAMSVTLSYWTWLMFHELTFGNLKF